jgi:hypothetical protein
MLSQFCVSSHEILQTSRDNASDFLYCFRLASISSFVSDAVRKYQKMQKKSHRKEMRRLSTDDSTKPEGKEKTTKTEVLTESKTSAKQT